MGGDAHMMSRRQTLGNPGGVWKTGLVESFLCKAGGSDSCPKAACDFFLSIGCIFGARSGIQRLMHGKQML
jgi:hypothetical protein